MKYFAVIGCQRCGTTLMGLILSTHPSVEFFEEGDATNHYKGRYATGKKKHIGYKIPNLTQNLVHKSMKYIFMERNIYQTVASMCKLNGWLSPHLAGNEIIRVIERLPDGEYKTFVNDLYQNLDYQQDHITATLVAQIKFNLYYTIKREFNILKVDYEQLVTNPFSEIKRVCAFLELFFDHRMLHHPNFTKKFVLWGTDSKRNIDDKSLNKYQDVFDGQQLKEINDLSIKLKTLHDNIL